MAPGYLPKPGTKYGPCKGKCRHLDCAATRATSEHICRLCDKPIGYETGFYVDDEGSPGSHVHAGCFYVWLEKKKPTTKPKDPDDGPEELKALLRF